jgi:hypothetical protein
MEIKRIIKYEVEGREFSSLEKATEYIDSRVHKHVQHMLYESEAMAKSSIKATEYLLKHRKIIAELLSVQLPQED